MIHCDLYYHLALIALKGRIKNWVIEKENEEIYLIEIIAEKIIFYLVQIIKKMCNLFYF